MELTRLESMDKLDVEYLKALSIIKPYVTCIMDNSYIEMVKLWLEKLSNDGRIDKMIRNQYLLHLGKQIQRGLLEYPFHQPPSERLDPLRNYTQNIREVDSEDLNLVLSMKKCPPGKKRRLRRSVFTPKSEDGFSDSSWQDLSDEDVVNYAAGDSSKPSNMFGPPVKRQETHELIETIEKLRAENATLTRGKFKGGKGKMEMQKIVSEIQVLKSRLHELLNIKTALQSSHSSLTSEWQNAVTSLHKKLAGLQKRNGELKNIIQHLEIKLNESLKKNGNSPQKCALLNEMHAKETELLKQKHKEELNKQEAKFSELLKEKCSDVSAKFSDLQEWYGKQLEENHASMKDFYDKQIEECGQKIREECEAAQERSRKEFEEKEIRRDKFYEKQLEDVRCEHAKEIRFKDGEIERLEVLLQEQCKRMQVEVQTIRNQLQAQETPSDENNNEKVVYLQKCITKLDKMYRKAEKEFAKQLLKLRREMDMREKHNQILMGTQRVNLISANNMAKQKEMDEIIGKLEQHYVDLLMEQQKDAFEQRKSDQKTIAELKTELAYLKANL